jgi:C_GCAxxG_C_C family probable redox protein
MSDTILRLMSLQGKDYPCSQMMMIMAMEEQDCENIALIRAMAGLANGCGDGSGSCGALSGASCILALYAAKGDDSERELNAFLPMLEDMSNWFSKKTRAYGGNLCNQITEGKQGSPEITERCAQLIADTYDVTMQLLVENGIDIDQARDED